MDLVNCGTPDAVSPWTRTRIRLWGAIFSMICFAHSALAEESHPGLAAESLYAEAVLAYNKKDYARARTTIEDLLKENPKNIDALQLLALIHRVEGNVDRAYGTYAALVRLQPEAQRGPYYFELASILYGKKRFAVARPLFLRALRLKFNLTPSHLFVGLIDFNDGKLNTALPHFEAVARDSDPQMAALGHFYTGNILLKNGVGSLGLGEMLETRYSAEKAPADDTSTQKLAQAAAQVIAPFDKSQWFASATVIPQFDSNVALFPITSPGATGLYTVRANYTAGGGYVTSPMRLFQFVASARIFGNFNFVPGTEVYNFHNFTPSIYLTYKPMARVSLGIKVEGTMTFQLGTSDGVNYTNRPFALVGDPGIFLKWQPTEHFQLQWDNGFRPQLYFTASDFGGWAAYTRASARVTTIYSLLNPGFGAGLEFNMATGEIWRYAAPSIELNNLMKLGSRDTLILSGTLTGYRYPWWERIDGNLVMRISNVFTVWKYFTWLTDLSYTINTSSSGNFSYNRWTAGSGIGFAF